MTVYSNVLIQLLTAIWHPCHPVDRPQRQAGVFESLLRPEPLLRIQYRGLFRGFTNALWSMVSVDSWLPGREWIWNKVKWQLILSPSCRHNSTNWDEFILYSWNGPLTAMSSSRELTRALRSLRLGASYQPLFHQGWQKQNICHMLLPKCFNHLTITHFLLHWVTCQLLPTAYPLGLS